jgi:hypothetical protein
MQKAYFFCSWAVSSSVRRRRSASRSCCTAGSGGAPWSTCASGGGARSSGTDGGSCWHRAGGGSARSSAAAARRSGRARMVWPPRVNHGHGAVDRSCTGGTREMMGGGEGMNCWPGDIAGQLLAETCQCSRQRPGLCRTRSDRRTSTRNFGQCKNLISGGSDFGGSLTLTVLLCNPMQEDSGDQEMVFYSGGESNAPTGVGFFFP